MSKGFSLVHKNDIGRAARAMLATNESDEFKRGVVTLAAIFVDMPDGLELPTSVNFMQGRRCLDSTERAK